MFNENFEIRERCKGVHCVDLGESFPFSQSSFQIDPNSNEYLLANFGFDTDKNEPYDFEISSSREFEFGLRSF